MAKDLIDMNWKISDIFHSLSPKERLRAMRNTMGVVSREIRKVAQKDLTSMSYTLKPRHEGEQPKPGKRAKKLKPNIIPVAYRRAIGFHVTIADRRARAGEHTKVDHQNRWGKWVPAVRWFETGTEDQEPRPFMERASRLIQNYEHRIMEVFEKKIDQIVEKHNAKL